MAWPGGPSGDDRPPDPNASGAGDDSVLEISVPDDLSALDEDVSAYRKEIRDRRRRERLDRWTLSRFWRPYGITGPVVIAALVVIGSVGGLLLALLPNARTSESPIDPIASASKNVGKVGGLLPDDVVQVDGVTESVRALRPAVIALVPATCHCVSTVDHIASLAGEFGKPTYVVSAQPSDPQMAALIHGQTSKRTAVYDVGGKLRLTYHATGVTVIVVRDSGIVQTVLRDVTSATTLRGALTLLNQALT